MKTPVGLIWRHDNDPNTKINSAMDNNVWGVANLMGERDFAERFNIMFWGGWPSC